MVVGRESADYVVLEDFVIILMILSLQDASRMEGGPSSESSDDDDCSASDYGEHPQVFEGPLSSTEGAEDCRHGYEGGVALEKPIVLALVAVAAMGA